MWIWIVVASVLVLVGVGMLAWWAFRGVPLDDEWACSKGEAPIEYANGGGGECLPDDTPDDQLPKGAHWDPLGNRPLSCHNRRGWTEVEETKTGDKGCLKDGLALPEGWQVVDDQ